MKKARGRKTVEAADDMLPEYRFDYRRAKPNRFVRSGSREPVVIALDSDVAAVFKTSKAVNGALRALISAMPPLNGGKRGK